MAKTNILTAKRLREVLTYNPKTGKFHWKNGGRSRWRPEAGSRSSRDGYVRINLYESYGKNFLAHRLAWLWMTGKWPKRDIDHINRHPADNRWGNLRDVSRSQNKRNNGRNGRAGICWDQPGPGRKGAWKVYIWREKVGHIHIGRYTSKSRAVRVANLLRTP